MFDVRFVIEVRVLVERCFIKDDIFWDILEINVFGLWVSLLYGK